MTFEWIGWVATGAFAASYWFRRPKALRLAQASAALVWVLYGALIEAWPVVVANVAVAGMAAWSSVRRAEA
jgi:hypothetical protein